MTWEEVREWSFRTESVQNGEEWFPQDFVYLCDEDGRQFCLGGFAAELRDELRQWAPNKERFAAPGT
jgi:hypothetical protein